MGGLFFALHTVQDHYINLEFPKSFMKMKCRGSGPTDFFIDTSPDVSKYKHMLSKHDFYTHNRYNYMYGYHQSVITDTSFNSSQPFVDPAPHKLAKYPELKGRPIRKLVCNGEVYNHVELKSEFSDADLVSESDVEVILPLERKYGIVETLRKLHGDFAFVLTKNTGALDVSDIEVIAARDPLGIRPLWMVNDLKGTFYLFVSELRAVPEYCKGKNWTTVEVPPGTYWTLSSRAFVKYCDTEFDVPVLYTTPDPSTLELLDLQIVECLTESVATRSLPLVGVFLSDGFDSSLLLSILASLPSKPAVEAFSLGTTEGDAMVKYTKLKYPEMSLVHHKISTEKLEIPEVFCEEVCECGTTEAKGLPIHLLLKIIKKVSQVKVVLHGYGLGGLFRQSRLACLDFIKKVPENVHPLDLISGLVDIEFRYPYLDTKFVTLIMSISHTLKKNQVYSNTRPEINKYLVRRAFRGSLPPETLYIQPKDLVIEYSTRGAVLPFNP